MTSDPVESTIGIRDLRQNASQVIKDAQRGTIYHVSLQGRDTGVVIAAQGDGPGTRPRGASLERARQSALYRGRDDAVTRKQLQQLERSRDAAGHVA